MAARRGETTADAYRRFRLNPTPANREAWERAVKADEFLGPRVRCGCTERDCGDLAACPNVEAAHNAALDAALDRAEQAAEQAAEE